MIIVIAIYVILSAIVAWLGRERKIGFAGFLILSLIITPFITAFILLVSSAEYHSET